MRIDFLGFEAFLCIGERGSFKRAAAHLNLSQTALSHRMRKFEEDLGVKLFVRSPGQLSLTPAGAELLPRAQKIMADLSGSLEDMRAFAGEKRAQVVLGCLPTIAAQGLPDILLQFAEKFPDVPVRVHDNSVAEIGALVEKGEADFGVTLISVGRWDFDVKPLVKDVFVMVCHADHPLAKEKSVQWPQLGSEKLIRISAQAGNRALIDDALASRRERLNWQIEVQHLASAVAMVEAGVAIAILPRSALPEERLTNLVAVPIANPTVTRTIGIVTRRGTALSREASALAGMIEKYLRRAARS